MKKSISEMTPFSLEIHVVRLDNVTLRNTWLIQCQWSPLEVWLCLELPELLLRHQSRQFWSFVCKNVELLLNLCCGSDEFL